MVEIIVSALLYTFIIGFSKFLTNKMQGVDKANKSISPKTGQKNYVIKPVNVAPYLWTFSFLSFLLVIIMFLIEHFLSPVETSYEKTGFIICVVLFLGSGIFLWFYGLYGVVWEVRVEGEKILHRTMLGKVREYSFSDITKVVSNHYDELRIYGGKKRIFTLTKGMDSYQFEENLGKLNIQVKDTKNMTIDTHVMQPLGVLKWAAMAGFLLIVWFLVKVIIDKEGLLLAVITAVVAILFLCGVLICFLEKTEVQGNKIIQHGFLKKKKVIEIRQISCIREDIEYAVIYSGKEKVMKIRKHNDGVALFREKMKKEKKKWYESE